MLRVEKHVARCAKCREHLDEELGWAAAMRSPFMARVREMIEERKKAAKGVNGAVGDGGMPAHYRMGVEQPNRLALALIGSPSCLNY
jgi:hypothetical protein